VGPAGRAWPSNKTRRSPRVTAHSHSHPHGHPSQLLPLIPRFRAAAAEVDSVAAEGDSTAAEGESAGPLVDPDAGLVLSLFLHSFA